MNQILHAPRAVRLLLLIVFVTGQLGFPSRAEAVGQDLEKKLTINIEKTNLKSALDQIATKASVVIIFSNLPELKNTVSLHVKNKSLKEALNDLLAPLTLSYRLIDDKIVIIQEPEKKVQPMKDKGSLPPASLKVGGKVTDAKGNALSGATIRIKGENRLTVTDKNGEFQLDNVSVNAVLQISFIGYQTQEIVIENEQRYLTIALVTNELSLDAVNVVSTGYQTLPKERATGSFAQVDNQLLNRRVSTDVISQLEGVVPGLLFNRNTDNSANGHTDISIRGTNTLFANNQPLIVLDNFPYDGDINNINPNDIENITILKDAAAASIWGVQSGNGVIVINTKKGRKNQPLTIELNANITVGNKPNLFYGPNNLKTTDFIDLETSLFNKGFYDSKLSAGYLPITPVVQILADARSGKLTSAQATQQIDAFRNVDVRDQENKLFYQKSVNQQYALSFRGGSAKSDYAFSLGDDHDLSYYRGNSNNRITVNSLVNFFPVKDLKLTAGINYVQSEANTDNPIYNGQLTVGGSAIYPYAQLADANGNALPIPKDYALRYTSTTSSKFLDWNYRPLDELNSADNASKLVDNRINLGAEYTFLKHFNLSLKYQYEHSANNSPNYYSQDTYFARNLINEYTQVNANGSLSYPIPIGGILQQSNSVLNSNRGRAQANYNNIWNQKHELNVIAGAEISDAVNETNANTAYGYNRDNETSSGNINYANTYTISPSGTGQQIPNSLGFGKTTDHYLSYFSNAAYTYSGRYTISASGRIDKSNLFGVNTNQKSVPLYSTGIAWDISKEGFYHLSWLPYVKLRGTYGYTGNINKSATAVTTLSQSSRAYYSGDPYNVIANPGNPELRWEKVRMINLGLDFGIFKNIISGSVEYYTKRGIDLFGNSPLAPSSGLTTFFGNTADTKGHGIDLVITSRNINNKNFKWTTDFLFSQVSDIVTKYDVMSTSASYINSSNASTIVPLVGKSLYGLYSYQWAGLTHTTGDPQGYLNGTVSTNYANIISKTPVSGMVYNGSSRPTIFGSFRNTFYYQAFSLSVNMIYKMDYYFRRTSFTSSGLPFATTDYYKRWQKPGDELITNVPSIQYPPFNNNRDIFYQNSSVLIDKGDHIRLQDITLSYNLDTGDKRQRLPFAHLQVYSYLNNLGILWRANKDHLDPDLSTNSTNALPLPFTISFGIKAKF